MRDEIFYGNLKGLLSQGKWTLTAKEAVALISIIQELDRRLKPPAVVPVEEPLPKQKTKPRKRKAKQMDLLKDVVSEVKDAN